MNAATDINAIESNTESTAWKDKKYYLWLLSPGLPLVAAGALLIYRANPKTMRVLSWIGPILVHGIIPVLDKIVGEDTSNPPEEVIKKLEKLPYYENVVRAFIPAQYALNLVAGYLLSRKDVPFLDKVGVTLTLGALNGVGINTAHELCHKTSKFERDLSRVALAPTGYGHFSIEHPFGHHKRAATPEDPASSKMGETFWEFLPRTVIGSLKSSIAIEKQRLARKGKGFFNVENELLQGWAMTAGYTGVMAGLFGKKILPYLAVQGVYGFSLLEVVNYIEHYGLLRQKTAEGKYERTQPHHSWNNNHVASNLVLYQLQRHSDHHAYPKRSFQALRHFDDTPQLPAGYPSMLLPAYIPALWFKIMDKRLASHYKGNLNLANILPKRRAAILAKFGVVDNQNKAE